LRGLWGTQRTLLGGAVGLGLSTEEASSSRLCPLTAVKTRDFYGSKEDYADTDKTPSCG
jgi:hypothetical protein